MLQPSEAAVAERKSGKKTYLLAMSMPNAKLIAEHRVIQLAAKSALSDLASQITASDTEKSIVAKACEALCKRGLHETWYYQCPALVLLGSRSCLSASGRGYIPSLETVGSFNLVTVDLSPMCNGRWGDCARSFFIEEGSVVTNPMSAEFAIGERFVESLHAEMQNFVDADTTFHELSAWAQEQISTAGFENLDFLGNVGHSIESRLEHRRFVKPQNHRRLVEADFFTFEPHVRVAGGTWGFKHENIYFFNADGRVEEL